MIAASKGGLLGQLTEVMLRGELVSLVHSSWPAAGAPLPPCWHRRLAVQCCLVVLAANTWQHAAAFQAATRIFLVSGSNSRLPCLSAQAADHEVMERVELLEPSLVRV